MVIEQRVWNFDPPICHSAAPSADEQAMDTKLRTLFLAVVVAATSPATALLAQEEEIPPDAEEMDEEVYEEVETYYENGEHDDEYSVVWQNPMRARISPSMTREGAPGSGRLTSAVSPGPMMFQVGLLGAASGGNNVIRLNDQNRSFLGNVLISGSFSENFGAYLGLGARNNVNTFGRPQAMLSQGDLHLGALGRYEVSPGVWLGGDMAFFVPSGFGSVGLDAAGLSFRPRLLFSVDLDEVTGRQDDLVVPLVAHLNLSYRFDNSESLAEGAQLDRIERFAYGISAYDLFEVGLGVEVPLPYVTPYLGWTLGVPVNGDEALCGPNRALECVADLGAASFPQHLSLGLKGEPLRNLGLHAGVDIGLTATQAEGLPMTLPFQVVFGASWTIDTTPVVEIYESVVEIDAAEPRGYLIGRVLNEETGEPIGDARIAYLDRDDTAQLSGAESGLFRSYGFAPGEELNLEISHPHYELAWASWEVEEGTGEIEIYLTPLPRELTMAGRVRVPEGANIEDVELFITGGDGETIAGELDGEGRFQVMVQSGLVTVSATLEGYLTAGRDVVLEAGADGEVDVVIQTPESEIVVGVSETDLRVQGRIDFEAGTSEMLDGVSEILDVVVAVLFENPQLRRVQIQGHVDDAGDDDYNMELSQRRADAVAQYLVSRGIAEERLEPEGYGSANPLVPNTSRRNRMLNRRIEFRILD